MKNWNKKLLMMLSIILVFSCKDGSKTRTKDYVSLSGKIKNHVSNEMTLVGSEGYKKKIKINNDGTFSDTLKISYNSDEFYFRDDSTGYYGDFALFLKNGFDLKINFDIDKFRESLKFSGYGAATNNYIVEKSLLDEKLITSSLFNNEEDNFKKEVFIIKNRLTEFMNKAKDNDVDSSFMSSELAEFERFEEDINKQYVSLREIKDVLNKLKGKPAPQFINYENNDGSKTSLSDLKGKYIYINVWLTRCPNCRTEIPYFKKIKEKYNDKNIEFVSISVDWGKEYYDKWKNMIVKKELTGIQLIADKSMDSDFMKAFKLNRVPHYILIDPQGNVVDANAPRPSKDDDLIKVFDNLITKTHI